MLQVACRGRFCLRMWFIIDDQSSKNLSTSNTIPLLPLVSAPKQHQVLLLVLFAGMLEDFAAPIKHRGVAEA